MLAIMRVVLGVIVVVAAVIGATLLRESGGRGAGMVAFALVVVVALSSLPVVLGRLASRGGAEPTRHEPPSVVRVDDEPPG
jgi:hypothetical protein